MCGICLFTPSDKFMCRIFSKTKNLSHNKNTDTVKGFLSEYGQQIETTNAINCVPFFVSF